MANSVSHQGFDPNQDLDAEQLLAERQRIDQAFKDKFVRTVTLMFTDLKGSTSLTEERGEIATRELLKRHNDILFPLIKENHGKLVKTMGDGTMSYFDDPQDALETAIAFQKAVLEYNKNTKLAIPIEVRVGLNTGEGIVEKDDVYGDVVNVASRFESIAEAGEIYFTKTTFQGLNDPDRHYIRKIKSANLKGKKSSMDVYKVFWTDEQILEDEKYLQNQRAGITKTSPHTATSVVRLLIWGAVIVLTVLTIMFSSNFFSTEQYKDNKRSTNHSIELDN